MITKHARLLRLIAGWREHLNELTLLAAHLTPDRDNTLASCERARNLLAELEQQELTQLTEEVAFRANCVRPAHIFVAHAQLTSVGEDLRQLKEHRFGADDDFDVIKSNFELAITMLQEIIVASHNISFQEVKP